MWRKYSPGVGGFGIGLLMWVLEMAGVTIPFLLLIALGIITAAMIVYSLIFIVIAGVGKLRGKKTIPTKVEDISRSLNLTDTLTMMHRRLVELQQYKALHNKAGDRRLHTISPTLLFQLELIKPEELPKYKRGIKQRIQRRMPRRNFRRQFNFKEFMKWRDEVRLAELAVASEVKKELFESREWTFEDGMKISEWIDGHHLGVRELRDNDSQWNVLWKSISHHLMNTGLRVLIDRHIEMSRLYNNTCLLFHYSEGMAKTTFLATLHETLVGSPISPTKIDLVLGEILEDIEKELQKESQPSSTEQNKSLQIQNPLSVGEFLGWVHAHKCSKCGWGIKVDIFNKVATCPKCGNVDNVDEGKESQLVIENVKRENYGNVAGFSWGLVVRNKGTDEAEECIGELVAIDFADKTGMSLKTWPTNQPLQWGNIPEYSVR